MIKILSATLNLVTDPTVQLVPQCHAIDLISVVKVLKLTSNTLPVTVIFLTTSEVVLPVIQLSHFICKAPPNPLGSLVGSGPVPVHFTVLPVIVPSSPPLAIAIPVSSNST